MTASLTMSASGVDALRAIAVSKSFGVTRALDKASIELRQSEVHILLGENGAGKSTLAKIIAGVESMDTGELRIDDRPVNIASARDARRLGIAMVFQELSLASHLSVRENLFLGSETAARPYSLLRRGAETAKAQAVLKRLGLEVAVDEPVANLSIAQKQLVEIAKVLARQPRIVIMDEPTSTLTEREKGFLFKVIRSLQQSGVAILYVTHHLREVMEIGDRVSAMTDGRVITTRDVTADLTEAELIKLLTGREASSSPRQKSLAWGEPVLTLKAVCTKSGCNDINLTVRPGEVVGVYGVVGCGRESIGRVLVGLETPVGGDIILAGKTFRPRHPAHARKSGISYMPVDRKEKGIFAQRSIRENLNLLNVRAFADAGVVWKFRSEATSTAQLLRLLSVRYRSAEDRITTLSGGNQQKVLFGRVSSGEPRVLLLEDPTSGIDAGAKADLHRLVRAMADRRLGVLLFSSDLPETLQLCDRVYTMYRGEITDEIIAPSLEDETRVLTNILGQTSRELDRSGYASVELS